MVFLENQARRLYAWRIWIALGGTVASFAILMIPRALHRFDLVTHGTVHIIRFAFPVLVWSWCVFFLCVWFHPRRGLFALPRGSQDQPVPRDISIYRTIFLGMLLLAFCTPFALWLFLLL